MHRPVHPQSRIGVTKIKKSGDEVEVSIPVHPEFRAVSDTIKHGHLNFIATERGAARSGKAFTNWIIEPAREAGCSASDIMSITGHRNLAEVETYVREASKLKLSDNAITKAYGAA